jgi:cyanophycinase-like exopeptidase
MFNRLIAVIMLAVSLVLNPVYAQSYTSYFTGSPFDLSTRPEGGVCMMGGATEHDEAMRWFLRRADGGDILVLRASGEDGYNDYMYSELGETVNSVETIVFNDPTAANEDYIHNKISRAEAIWFAGGDQWDYVSFWRNTAIDSLINDALVRRNIVIGGTSAGMAILGKYYFTSQNGTVTSEEALSNPYDPLITVDSTDFLHIDYMQDVITDTHYDARSRQGRHIVFLARILTDYAVPAKGIACNEYTAVCIDGHGLARVYGDYPNYPEAAFFLQTNCELENFSPENCSPSNPLEWNLNGEAIRVCKVNGTNEGVNTFDLRDWETTDGGTWENWFVENGQYFTTPGVPVDCPSESVDDNDIHFPQNMLLKTIYPNPFNPSTTISFDLPNTARVTLTAYDMLGREVAQLANGNMTSGTHSINWQCPTCASGTYLIELRGENFQQVQKAILMR